MEIEKKSIIIIINENKTCNYFHLIITKYKKKEISNTLYKINQISIIITLAIIQKFPK